MQQQGMQYRNEYQATWFCNISKGKHAAPVLGSLSKPIWSAYMQMPLRQKMMDKLHCTIVVEKVDVKFIQVAEDVAQLVVSASGHNARHCNRRTRYNVTHPLQWKLTAGTSSFIKTKSRQSSGRKQRRNP
jgi:hypothetical protein